jgi:hypothetical protein
MKYAILRTQKLKSGQAIRRSLTHSFREQDTPNADASRTSENAHMGADNTREALDRFNELIPEKVRKNAVLAVEYLITASPEAMQDKSRERVLCRDTPRRDNTAHVRLCRAQGCNRKA